MEWILIIIWRVSLLFGLLDLLWDWIVCVFDLSVVSLGVTHSFLVFLQILCGSTVL